MVYELTVFAMIGATVLGSTVAAWLLSGYQRQSAAYWLGCFMLSIAFWSGTHVGTLLSETRGWQLTFTQLSYVSVVTVPVLWVAFALAYADRTERLSRARLGLLSVVPAVTLALAATAQHHALFYESIALGTAGGRPILEATPGPWHAVNIVYSYSLLLFGTVTLVRSALSDNRLYRRQAAALIVLVTVPWAVNVLYHLGVRPIPWVDPTPLALVAVGVPLAGVVVRSDLASFLPVAHERVFRTLGEPVIVVAPDGRIVDANGPARTLFWDGGALEGAAIQEALPPTLLADGALAPDLDDGTAVAIDRGGEPREYLARRREIDPAEDGPQRGSILTLTDITDQRRRQRALERKTEALEAQTARLERTNERLERLADIVAHDMQAPLSTAEKLLALLEGDLDDPDRSADRTVEDLAAVHDRLREFAEHMPRLARESTDVESTEEGDLSAVAVAAWDVVETGDVDLVVEDTAVIRADLRRLRQVFENIFRNAVEHGNVDVGSAATDGVGRATDGGVDRAECAAGDAVGGTADSRGADAGSDRTGDPTAEERPDAAGPSDRVSTVRVGTVEDGVYVADDGPGIAPERRESVFEYGTSTGDGSGFGLAIVRTIVEAHGWSIDVTESASGGARFDIVTDR